MVISMKLFFDYLKSRIVLISVFVGSMIIFMVSFVLYKLPLQAVLYPVTLVTVLCVFLLLGDFSKVKKKHDALKSLSENLDEIESFLPKSDTIPEQDYQNLVDHILEELRKSVDESSEKYNDMVDYYSIWVHQIKTPIASMRLLVQGEDSDFSRKVNSDLKRIEQYVEMVLTFLRLDSKETDYLLKEYDLDPVIKTSVKKFMNEFISRKIKLNYEPVNVRVLTDEKWLSFVIEQVISNALKYTPEGEISIFMRNENELCISDTGIGILPEDISRIFEKGYTGFNGRMDKKASGIGLYLCKRICNNLGHTIKAESRQGEGTTVIIGLKHDKIEIE